jgi:hypothetical protein
MITSKIRKYDYIAVDFDGTLCVHAYPMIGAKEAKHVKLINWLIEQHNMGTKIILWTCREGITLFAAVEWCKNNNVPIDYVNENPEFVSSSYYPQRKIIVDLYIDDKAVNAEYFYTQL